MTQEFERIIEEYNGDCFFFTRHQGCKSAWAMGKVMRDICKKAGLPALFLAADSFDKRLVSEQEIKKQITDFFQANGFI